MNIEEILDMSKEEISNLRKQTIELQNQLSEKRQDLRDGNFQGVCVETDKKNGISKYELKLPTDSMFNKVHGDIILHYSVYQNQRIIMLDNLTPDDILTEGHQKELTTYKGVMVSKTHADKDIFKINLLNMINK